MSFEPGLMASLTEKHLETIRLAADGYTADEIGRRLFVSHDSVDDRLSRARAITGCRTTIELVAYALRRGLIE